MSRLIMNRLLLGAALAGAAALAACEEPHTQTQPIEPAVVEDAAPAAEDSAASTAGEAAEAPAPATTVEALPPDQRTSEQTVQPESDTLFY